MQTWVRLGLMLAVAGVVILTSGESAAFRASTERMSAGNAVCDAYVDLGNTADEDFHNLVPQGWDGSEGPPNNPHVSPSGDWTKRYQKIGQANSVDLCPTTGADSYFLLAEVEDGQCQDDFEIWVGPCGESQEQVYAYQARPGQPTTVGRHVVGVDGSLVGECTTVTFQNKAQDGCGSAAVYNVSIQTSRPPTIVIVRDEWEGESGQSTTDRPDAATLRVAWLGSVPGAPLAKDFSHQWETARAEPLAPDSDLHTPIAVEPVGEKVRVRVATTQTLAGCSLQEGIEGISGHNVYDCTVDEVGIVVSANSKQDWKAEDYNTAYVRFSPYTGNDTKCALTASGGKLQGGPCLFGTAAVAMTPAKVLREECTNSTKCTLLAIEYTEERTGAATDLSVPDLVLRGIFRTESERHYERDPDQKYRTLVTFDGGIGFSQATGSTFSAILTKYHEVLPALAAYCNGQPSTTPELVSCVAASPEADLYIAALWLAKEKWTSGQCDIAGIEERRVIANWVGPVRRYKGRSTNDDHVRRAFCDPELPFRQYWDWPIYVQDYASSDVAVGSGQCTLRGVFGSGCGGQVLAVHLHQSEQQELEVAILPDQEEADFFTQGFGSTVDTTLVAPDGTLIGPDSADPDVHHVKALTYELYRIASPQPGDWAVRLFGTELPPEGEDMTVWVSTVSAPASIPVGGIAELPDVSASSAPNYIALVGLAPAALIALTAGAWYARRRWVR